MSNREQHLRKALEVAAEALECACISLSAAGKWSAQLHAREHAEEARRILRAADTTGNPEPRRQANLFHMLAERIE